MEESDATSECSSSTDRIKKYREIGNAERPNKSIGGRYTITVPPNGTTKLFLKLLPTATGSYTFPLPIRIKGYEGALEGFSRNISYQAIEPTLIIEPQVLDFKKKIISDKEQKLVKAEIFNPSNRMISWSIVQSSGRSFVGDQPFRIEPMSGELPPQ